MTCTYCGSSDHARHCPLCGRGMLEQCSKCEPTHRVQEDEPQPATVPYHEAAHPALVQLWRDERVAFAAWQRRAVAPYIHLRSDVDGWLSLPMDDDP